MRKKAFWSSGRVNTILCPVISVALALLVGSILIILAGASPATAYAALFRGAFGTVYNFTEVLVKASPLWLAAMAVVLSFRTGMFNCGAEGQIFMGALAATGVGVALGGYSSWLLLPLVFLASFVAGGIWGGIPGLMKAQLGVNEIISTIMFNYIATWIVSFFVNGPWRDTSSMTPQTNLIGEGAFLSKLIPGTRLHSGIIVTLILVIAVHFLLNKSVFGYKARLVGTSQTVAAAAGIPVSSVLSSTMFISGGLAGLAGMIEITGLHHRLLNSFSPGYGFTAITVALLGKLNPFGALISGLFFAALTVGANEMQRSVGIPNSLISIIQALVVIFLLIGDIVSVDSGIRKYFPKCFKQKREATK